MLQYDGIGRGKEEYVCKSRVTSCGILCIVYVDSIQIQRIIESKMTTG